MTYLGFRVRVPASWPVISLARRPATCARFDRHAVYLGDPGIREACPARLVAPHTGALLISPMLHAGPRPGVTQDRESEQITVADPAGGIEVTATYGPADKGLVERMIAHAHLPATRARGNPAPPRRVLAVPPRVGLLPPPGPTGGTSYTGNGFDTCAAPATGLMAQAMSTYGSAIGIYIGGSNRGCAQPNLTASWVSTQDSAGWHFMPIYVGPQASTSLTASGGATAADDAMQQAQSLGFGPGSPIYYDMEGFMCSCSAQVTVFLSGWTGELHDNGYLSGVYGSGASTMNAEVADYNSTSDRRPDILWYATADGNANVDFSGLPNPVPDSYWPDHQRINQYTLNKSAPFLGSGSTVDLDYMDAVIAASPDSGLDSMFNSYGDNATCANWSGGDATNSVALPSGDRAWFFSDSYLGSPADRKTLFYTSSLHNSIVLQQGSSLTTTITGGNTCQERNTSLPFLSRYADTPAVPSDAINGAWYWTGDQMLVGSNVVKFYYHVSSKPPDSFSIDYPAVATIPVASLESDSVLNITPAQVSCGPGNIIWGTALLNWQNNVYIYGYATGGGPGNSIYLAKTTASDLANPDAWSLYDGLDSSGNPIWTATGCPQSAAPLAMTGTTGFSVTAISGSSSLWAIQFDYTNGQANASGAISAHPASTPWGFTNNSVALYYPPEGHVTYPDYYQVYEARIQPGLGSPGTVVISYNVNTTAVDTGCVSANVHDATIYRPRFVDIPTSAFDAAAAAPAPAVTAAAVRASGIRSADMPAYGIRDSRPPANMSARAARTPRAAAPAGGPIDNADDWFQRPLGGSCPAISAPGPLQASPSTPTGQVTLSWTQPTTDGFKTATDVWYYAYDCDKTATGCPSQSASGGYKKEWGGLWATTTSGTVDPVGNLTTQFDNPSGHLIDFYVQSFGASNGSGGGNSGLAEEPVTVQPPSAPTGLAVTGNSAGQVSLSWNQVTFPSSAVFYTVYDCDQTTTTGGCGARPTATSGPAGGWGQPNGDTGGLTATTAAVPSLTPGDVYEFCVQAANLGGNGNCSAVVSATVAG